MNFIHFHWFDCNLIHPLNIGNIFEFYGESEHFSVVNCWRFTVCNKLYICCLVLFIGILIVGLVWTLTSSFFMVKEIIVKHDTYSYFPPATIMLSSLYIKSIQQLPLQIDVWCFSCYCYCERLGLFLDSLNKISKLNGNGILVLIIDWTLIELNQIILLYVQKVYWCGAKRG